MSLPNYITLVRIIIVPFFFTQLVLSQSGEAHHRKMALILLITACLTDAIDGFLARAMKQKTQLGRFLDPLADKLLILSGFLGLLFVTALPYHPPLWITVTIAFRELVLVGGLIIIFFINHRVDVRPNLLGKACTATQMATLCAILMRWQIAIPLSYLVGILTVSSCVVYAARELKHLEHVT